MCTEPYNIIHRLAFCRRRKAILKIKAAPAAERKMLMLLSRLFSAGIVLLLSVSVFFMPVYAVNDVDIDYEGEIDPYSGEPVDSSSSASEQTVTVMTGVSYDRKSHMFVYSVPGTDDVISCSVASGMVTTEAVSLSVPSDLTATLYKNGEIVDKTDFTKIKKEGAYALVLSGDESKSQFLTFTIVPSKTGALSVFQVPSGFSLVNVMFDDEKQKYSAGANTVDMQKEGEYSIGYRCPSIEVNFSLSVTIDHTPPEVTYEGIKNGIAKNPVSIKGIEKSDTVKVMRDGEEMNISKDNVIRSPGKYVVTVTDDAGNSVTEKFEIKFYLNEQGWVFGLLILAIIAMAVIYMIMSKKKLRVR